MSSEEWYQVLLNGTFEDIQRTALSNMDLFDHYTRLFDLKRMHRFCQAVDYFLAEYEMVPGVHAGLSSCYDPRGLYQTLVDHELWPFYISQRPVADLEGESALVYRVEEINRARAAQADSPRSDFTHCDICGFHHFLSSSKRKTYGDAIPDLKSSVGSYVLFPPQ